MIRQPYPVYRVWKLQQINLALLTWRVIKRDRNAINDDPAMIRHLHDLYALREIIKSDIEGFQELFTSTFDEDMKYRSRILDKSLAESVTETARTIKAENLYRQEYEQFVAKVSYAEEQETIQFDTAVEWFEDLSKLFT